VAVGVRVGVRVGVKVRVLVGVRVGVSVLCGVLVMGKVGETGRLVLVGGGSCSDVGVAVERFVLIRINVATNKTALRLTFNFISWPQLAPKAAPTGPAQPQIHADMIGHLPKNARQ
jgi:hypothetical protein